MQKLSKYLVLLAAFISYLTFAPPNHILIDIEPVAYSTHLFKSFDGPLKHNTILSHAEHLFVNEIHGPESLAVWNSQIYTGTFGGQIIRIEGTELVPIAKIGDGKCDVVGQMEQCGRPLGLRFNSKGILYVIDAYHGLYMIESITTLEPNITQLLPLSATKYLKGGQSLFLDDITVDESAGADGGDVIYISDVSTKWDLSKGINILIEHDTSGRLLKYDITSKQLTVVAADFVLPNGVQITDNKEAIIVCEFGRQRLMRTFIKGSKTGETELFTELPGECDNIRRSTTDRETYWVAFASVRNASNPLLFLDRLSGRPLVRKFVVRLAYLTGTLIETVGNLCYFETMRSFGGSLKSGGNILFYLYASDYGMITEVNADGKIITAYSSPDGKTNHLSEVCEVVGSKDERILFIGSYSNSYLGRLVVKK